MLAEELSPIIVCFVFLPVVCFFSFLLAKGKILRGESQL